MLALTFYVQTDATGVAIPATVKYIELMILWRDALFK
jgi:hypothetical protein